VERVINNCGKLDWWWCKSNRHARSIWRKQNMFAQMIAVDVLVANLWMGFYFMGSKSDKIDKWLKESR
jgi:hypothetical protein